MSEAGAPVGGLLVLVDPVARRLDGESVRIAKDVLSAGAAAKICLPDSQEEFARALARRGQRQPVIVGDDGALVRAVGLLHRERGLGESALALVPVGPVGSLALAMSLGVPQSTVAAARAVLDGSVRTCDLLVDDSDGVVLGALRISPLRGPERGIPRPAGPSVWSAYRSLVRTLVRPVVAAGGAGGGHHRLRVEADGVVLADVDQPVADVSVRTRRDGEPAEVAVRTGGGFAGSTVTARAKTVTVSGADFRYRADGAMTGPVRRRTWTLRPGSWMLTLPR
ncbi:diacylglycerol kinase [Streptomyces sp. PCS3-D2]|uniref:diacylglycerol kinase family protein n=1 Tax=Streptomyces sp. PCS3-D2 TaxID=1460244 RepID=UPI00044A5DCF|nr:diacylglycerol kinase family protein [Streptomyces sp. PCS3-D2]WKV76232.1 diacylglycerol kinase [Streptomyces sp. PCS3-D2]